MDGPKNLNRLLGVGDRRPDQSRFQRTAYVGCASGTQIPGRGNHHLVIADFPIFNGNPMSQRTAWGFIQSDTRSIVGLILGALGVLSCCCGAIMFLFVMGAAGAAAQG